MNHVNRTYNLYCDESCHLENDHKRFMLLAYVMVPYHQVAIHKEAIDNLKKKHHYYGEIKWSKVAHAQAAFYDELTDYFFAQEIHFRAVVVRKDLIQNDVFDQDFDTFYYKMYYQLIYHKLDMGAAYNIYLDIKDTLSRSKVRELRQVLQLRFSSIRNLQNIRSHESVFVQLADFLMGAVSYHLNQPDGLVIAKQHIISRIKEQTGHSLDCSTDKGNDKFNLFFFGTQRRASQPH